MGTPNTEKSTLILFKKCSAGFFFWGFVGSSYLLANLRGHWIEFILSKFGPNKFVYFNLKESVRIISK